MSRSICLYHPVRMTYGGFCPLIPSGRDNGWGFLVCPNPSGKKKIRFLDDNGGPRRVKVVASSHHMYHATVNGHVEESDTKGSTWISKDTR